MAWKYGTPTEAECVNQEVKCANSGTWYIELTWMNSDGDSAPHKVWLTDKCIKMIAAVYAVLGIPKDTEPARFAQDHDQAYQVIGKKALVTVEINEYKGVKSDRIRRIDRIGEPSRNTPEDFRAVSNRLAGALTSKDTRKRKSEARKVGEVGLPEDVRIQMNAKKKSHETPPAWDPADGEEPPF